MNEFINKITKLGLSLEAQGDALLLKGAQGKLSASEIELIKKNVEITTFIKANKEALIQHLNSTKTYDGKINKNDIAAIYELSPLQEGILFHSLYNPQGTTYKTQFSMEFSEGLDLNAFIKSWEYLMKNHTILRTSFVHDQLSVPVQCVYKEIPFRYELLDFTQYTGEVLEQKFQETVLQERQKEFNFKKPPLMRVTLVKTGEKAIRMIWTKHHILWDGWSGQILMGEFLQAYEAFTNDKTPPVLREDKFEDYIKHIKSIDPKEEKQFWQNYLAGFEESTLIPFVNYAVKEENRKGNFQKVTTLFNEELTTEINAYTKKANITVNSLLQGIWSLLLSEYTNKKDVAFGVTVSGRPADAKYEKKVGLYINTIPLRTQIDTEQSLITWLQSLQVGHAKARAYQHASLTEIKRNNNINDDFFDSILVFRNFPINNTDSEGKNNGNGLAIQNYEVKENNNFPLSIQADLDEQLNIDFQYNQELIEESHIHMIASHFEHLLLQIIQGSIQKIKELSIVSEAEKTQILHEFNNTAVDYSQDVTVVDLIQKQLEKTPNQVAVAFEGTTLTYQELDEKSNQLAHYLLEKGVQKNAFVGLCIERSLEMIISIVGILKVGAAYVPIDPEYPQDRIAYILDDIATDFVITTQQHQNKIPTVFSAAIITYTSELLAAYSTAQTTVSVYPSDIAYVIYTSGSTGKPKGVMNAHSGLYNRLLWAQDSYQLDMTDTVLQKTTFCFDVSVWELLLPLCTGAKLLFAKPEGHKDNAYLKNIIENEKVTTIHFVPSMLSVFLLELTSENCPSLRRVVCSGEALQLHHIQEFKRVFGGREIHFQNLYGPTEAAIDVTFWNVPLGDTELKKSLIGKPIANTRIYILDADHKVQPIGVTGELCIGGIQVSEGYLNKEGLTVKNFIANPFVEGERIYKTGDLAKWLPDGNIEYIGRKDSQVKIRGYRIELGEIETAIQEIASVQNASVIVKKGKNNHAQLLAFVTGNQEIDITLITAHLKEKLPVYMVPNTIMQIEEFPLNKSGKLDRKALLNQFVLPEKTYIAPTTITEHKIVEIWKELLGLEEVSIDDDFFLIGGDSILLIRMLTQLKKQLQKTIELQKIYEYSVLKDLARFIEIADEKNQYEEAKHVKNEEINALKAEVLSSIQNPEAIEDVYPMRDIQEGMIYEYFRSNNESVYHDQFVYVIPNVNFKIFKKAFGLMIAKHETLRTAFNMRDFKKNYQIVYKEIDPVIKYEDITDLPTSEQESYIKAFLRSELRDKFIPNNTPLWRAKIFRLNQEMMVYVFQFHHAILDGWSLATLNTELYQTCMQLQKDSEYQPSPLKITNKMAVVDSLIEKENTKTAEFWQSYMEDYQPLNILSDTKVDETQQEFFKNIDLTTIQHTANALGIPLKTVFLGAYIYALQLMTYERDLTIGLVANNRPISEDGEKLLGCFLNTIPFRVQMSNDIKTWKEFLLEIQKNLDALKTNDRISLQQISTIIGEDASVTSKIFNIGFNFTNFHIYNAMEENPAQQTTASQEEKETHAEDQVQLKSYERTNIDFGISVGITGNKLKATFTQKKAFNSGIELNEFITNYSSIVSLLTSDINAEISHTEIFTEKVNTQLLETFNTTETTYDTEKTIVAAFVEQAKIHPTKTALEVADRTMTYKELDVASNRLANYLLAQGKTEVEDFTGIKLQRNEWLIVSILAVLKSGCAYVPIDPKNPAERIEFIESDSNCKLIIDQAFLDTFLQQEQLDETQPFTKLTSKNLAYVIYTSGSTGKPKGVLIEHQSVVNLIEDLTKTLEFTSTEKSILMINHAFDASVEQLFLVLLNGATIVLAPEGFIYDPSLLKPEILKRELTHIPAPPSYLNQLGDLSECTSLRRVVTGGEYFPYALAEKITSYTRFFNEYGPTEATVTATVFEFKGQYKEAQIIPIGTPLANFQLYILSENLELQAQGVIGEICVSGDGLGRGYLNRPDLTNEKFVANPFKEGERLYRTGDLGKWLPDGNMVFIGRKDNQVKIRGHRIEIEEIEQALHQTENIDHAIIEIMEVNDEKSIVAYIVADLAIDKAMIKNSLAKRLPEYMVPNYYIILEEFPTTFNGKIDRRALPAISDKDIIKQEYVAPRNQDEERLITIWKELLTVESIGIKDSFFELGGNSLLALRAITNIQEAFNISIPIDVYFKLTTIENISDYIASVATSEELEEDNYEIFEL